MAFARFFVSVWVYDDGEKTREDTVARFSVGDIENVLFEAYPATDALPQDRFGLLVGDRTAIVSRIAIALDQTVPMVEGAAAAGCNLLVAHHPGFFLKPESFLEAPSAATADGAVVYKAAQKGVALLTMHTNLDCAPSAAEMLLAPVGLAFEAPLKPNGAGSLGQIARPVGREYVELGALAAAYQQEFGHVAKVWGDPGKPLFSVAACSGGAGEVVPEVVAASVDCFVTGELRHHEALYLADENIALIELGHDISELPYRFELRKVLVAAGFPPGDIIVLEPSATWWQVGVDAETAAGAAKDSRARRGNDRHEGMAGLDDTRGNAAGFDNRETRAGEPYKEIPL
ncbi:MAG: Nif3-like dinuclear metal center hexameric protein [Coriobacteriales bacterium]|nr:Nif3-like dinuclear metal center hexameric protein [Coriobacteriales bacterium]